MTLSPLFALAGSAAGSFAAGAAQGVLDGISHVGSFSQTLDASVQANSALAETGDEGQDPDAEALAKLHEAALDYFRKAGIDVNQPIRFLGGSAGPWMVQGAHPDLLRIEQLLERDPQLHGILDQIDALVNDGQSKLQSFEISETGLSF